MERRRGVVCESSSMDLAFRNAAASPALISAASCSSTAAVAAD